MPKHYLIQSFRTPTPSSPLPGPALPQFAITAARLQEPASTSILSQPLNEGSVTSLVSSLLRVQSPDSTSASESDLRELQIPSAGAGAELAGGDLLSPSNPVPGKYQLPEIFIRPWCISFIFELPEFCGDDPKILRR